MRQSRRSQIVVGFFSGVGRPILFFSVLICTALLLKVEPAFAHGSYAANDDLPIIDTHVHYSQDAWSVYPPREIIGKMNRVEVSHAAVSSSPDDGTRMLYKEAPERIIPFLRPYHDGVNSSNWYTQTAVIPYLQSRLETPIYKGIGEFHLYDAKDAQSPVVRQTVRMAVERGLYLHVHSNALAVRAIFAYEPKVKLLWAHAGMSEPPELVSQMMDEFENLWTDTSYRESAIAPDGKLDPAWQQLFLKHTDRITVGTDTWVTSRWNEYERLIQFDRGWLKQLPRDVAEKIAYRNAARLFGVATR